MKKPESFAGLESERLRKSQNILRTLRTIMRSSLTYSDRVEKKTGISATQLWMLSEIAHSPGIKVKDLARILSIHQSTCSNILDKLQKKDLVKRDRTGQDQRVVSLYPTEKGTRLLVVAPRPIQGIIAEALLHLPDEVLTSIEDSLEKLIDSMKFIEEQAGQIPIDHQL